MLFASVRELIRLLSTIIHYKIPSVKHLRSFLLTRPPGASSPPANRQASASHEQAIKLLDALGLDHALAPSLTGFPVKGGLMPTVPVDPLLYRFYEILQIYGLPLKDVIQ